MLRTLLVTYAIPPVPFYLPAMMGALKRCLRLVKNTPVGALDVHWVHRGPLFEHDPLIAEMARQIPRYDFDGNRVLGTSWLTPRAHRSSRLRAALQLPALALYYGQTRAQMGRGIRSLVARLRPDVVVLSDNPLAGILLEASQAAAESGVPQIGVDDFLSEAQPAQLLRASPSVDEWVLVGLPARERLGRIGERVVVTPPLLPPSGGAVRRTGEVTVLGYDPGIARLGLEFAAALGPGTRARLISGALSALQQRNYQALAPGVQLTFAVLPDEAEFRRILESSALVFCKNGFQQIAESLALGTPAVACEVAGGADECFLDRRLLPWVKYIQASGAQRRGWSEALAAARSWRAENPPSPWADVYRDIPDLARASARLFADCLLHAVNGRATGGWAGVRPAGPRQTSTPT